MGTMARARQMQGHERRHVEGNKSSGRAPAASGFVVDPGAALFLTMLEALRDHTVRRDRGTGLLRSRVALRR